MNIEIIISNLIFLLALIVSYRSYRKTKDFQDLQNKYINLEKKLKEKELEQKKKAELYAELTRDNKKLMIINRGEARAENIEVQKIGEKDIGILDLNNNNKYFQDIFESGQEIALLVAASFNTDRRMKIKLCWDDRFGKNREKEIIIKLK